MNVACLLDYAVVVAQKRNELNLLVRMRAPEVANTLRRPLNLGLVVDHSGSMQGEKIEQTKAALKQLVSRLAATDTLSLVVFDNTVDVLLEPTQVKDKDKLRRTIQSIEAAGGTNLSAGWLKGLDLVASNAKPDSINRVILLSDGQANDGIVDNDQLMAIGAAAKNGQGIATTALGFGRDFNEDLLTGIAKASGGQFAYIAQADQATAVFAAELEGLINLAAQNVEVALSLSETVDMAAQWSGYPMAGAGRQVKFHLGDMFAGEEKNLLLGLLVRETAKGLVPVADLELNFNEVTAQAITTRRMTAKVSVDVQEGAVHVEPNLEVIRELTLQRAARARDEAIKKVDEGDLPGAQFCLRQATDQCLASPVSADAAVQAEIAELREHEEKLKRDQAGTRKDMRTVSYLRAASSPNNIQAHRVRNQPKP